MSKNDPVQEINPFSMGEIERIHNLMENIPDKDGPNGDSKDLLIWHREAIKHYEKTKDKIINARKALKEACENPLQCGVIEPNDTDCAQCEWYSVWKALRE